MKKFIVFIFFVFLLHLVFLFFISLAIASTDEIFSSDSPPQSTESLTSKIESSLPYISYEDYPELAEAVQLIKELEREIFLTNKMLDLREEGKIDELEGMLEEEVEEVIELPAPEEIVVATHISEEPEKIPPPAEESLTTEVALGPEDKKLEYIFAEPAYRPEVITFEIEELEKIGWNIVIEKGQTAIMPAPGIRRFMTTDPSLLMATRTDDEISITALDMGKAYLHIWDSEGRRTAEITVRQRGYKITEEAFRRAAEAPKMESFKARYSFSRYRINSKSLNAHRSYHFTDWVHFLRVTGETPWGMSNSGFQYEGRDSGRGQKPRQDLVFWSHSLRGPELDISFGNTGTYFSDITLPGTGYQGIRFKNPDEENINYDFVWGARGNRMWGYRVVHWTDENYFYGVRSQIEPTDNVHFNATFVRALESEMDVAEHIYAGGMGFDFLDDALKIETEFARGKRQELNDQSHAYKIDSTLKLEDYKVTLRGTYRDIDPNFLAVTTTGIPHVGALGYYFDFDYKPLNYLRLHGIYNIFRNRVSFNPTDPSEYNYNWRNSLEFDIGPNTEFAYANWVNIHEGESTPLHSRGESYQVSHTLSLPQALKPVSLYFTYAPTQYKSLSSLSGNYRERRYSSGLRWSFLKNFYYDVTHSWQYKKMLEGGERGMLKTLSTGLSYASKILDTPFYGALDCRYEKEYGVMQNLPLSAGENVVSSDAEISYRPDSGDVSTFLRVNYRHIRGVLDHNQNRQEMRIIGGGDCLFDTTLSWGVGGCVRGYVFKDFNTNGQKDLEEPGIPGMNVYAGDFYEAVTDAEGRFEIARLKDYETSVMFDTKMLPEGYKPVTPNPQTVKLERGLVSEANFGVAAIAEITGVVFNDINMNRVFDKGDEGVNAVLLVLDYGAIAQTMPSGHYRMENIKPGARRLTMDAATLPPHLLPLTLSKKTLEVKEGEYYEEYFPVYTLRTVVGNVFIDENGNNQFDSGEKGVYDVTVGIGDNVTVTDEMGRYFLKKLAGGTQKVEVDIESLPEGYGIVGDAFIEVTLSPDGEIKEDVNFALLRKR